MEVHGLFESEDDDYVARMSATVVHKQLSWWVQNNEDRLARRTVRANGGGFVITSEMFDMDEDYPDLLIALMPESNDPLAPGFGSKAGLATPKTGVFAGKKMIVLRCLMGPNDTTNAADRIRVGFRKAFVHEFQHYLMTSRTPDHVQGSTAKIEQGGLPAYFNDNDETNAYYLEATHDIADFFETVRTENPQSLKRFSDMTTMELIDWSKKEFFFAAFLAHASPKTTQALNKRLLRFFEQSIRPMMARVLRNYEE